MKKCVLFFLSLTLLSLTHRLLAQGAAFTYQGQLNSSGSPANGIYDFTFALFNNSSTNTGQIGSTITQTNIGVTNGLFNTTLDFGDVFTGNATWLAMTVRSNGEGGFIALTPLQKLTPTPYAMYAPNAGSATSANSVAATNITGAIALAQLPGAVVTNNDTTPLTLTSGLNVGATFVFDGDSMTAWANGEVVAGNYNDYPDRLLQLPGFYFHHAAYDFGVPSVTAEERWFNYANAAGSVTATDKILFYWIGYNDVNDKAETDAEIEDYIKAYWNTARSQGYYVVAFTFHTNASWTQPQMVQWTNVTTWIRGATAEYNTLVDEAAFVTNPAVQLIGGISGIHLNAANNAALAVMISTNAAILNYLGPSVADSTDLSRVVYADVLNGDNSNITANVPITAPGFNATGTIAGGFIKGNTGQFNVGLGIGTAAPGAQGWINMFNPTADSDILFGNNAGNQWLLGTFNNQANFRLYSYSWPGAVWNVDKTGDVTFAGNVTVTGKLGADLTNSSGLPITGILATGIPATNTVLFGGPNGIGNWGVIPGGGDGGGLTKLTAATPAIPPAMALIPAGSFTMGDTLDGEADAIPTTITVSAFYMDVNLVSYSQWLSVYFWATNQGYRFDDPGIGTVPNVPVQWLNWYDCVIWCNARSQQAGLTPVYYTDTGFANVYTSGDGTPYANWTANGYRLPTEAEWEKAARGGLSGQRFPWGNFISESLASYYGETVSYSYDLGPNGSNPGDSASGPTPLGYFAPNEYGLYDMAGNVFEWCWDFYGTPYGQPTATNPTGPPTGSLRVYRGGEFNSDAKYSRCANRNGFQASPVEDINIVLRCVRSP